MRRDHAREWDEYNRRKREERQVPPLQYPRLPNELEAPPRHIAIQLQKKRCIYCNPDRRRGQNWESPQSIQRRRYAINWNWLGGRPIKSPGRPICVYHQGDIPQK